MNNKQNEAYDQIERFLRNNLDDDDFAEYEVALDTLIMETHPVKELSDEEIKANTITEVLNYFEEARYELEADFVFKLKKHFQIFGEEE